MTHCVHSNASAVSASSVKGKAFVPVYNPPPRRLVSNAICPHDSKSDPQNPQKYSDYPPESSQPVGSPATNKQAKQAATGSSIQRATRCSPQYSPAARRDPEDGRQASAFCASTCPRSSPKLSCVCAQSSSPASRATPASLFVLQAQKRHALLHPQPLSHTENKPQFLMDAVDLFAPDDAHDDVHFRLSLDSDGEPQSPLLPASLPPLVLPPLVLPSLEASGDHALLWNLISPCSEPPESPISVKMEDLTLADAFQDVDLDERPEPEPEKTVGPVQDEIQKPSTVSVKATVSVTNTQTKKKLQEEEEGELRYASCSDSDDDDEEVEVFNADKSFLTRRSSLDGKTLDGSEKLDSVTEADEMDEIDDVEVSSTTSSQMFFDDSTSEDGSHSGRASYATMGGKWVGRMKARTYSGSASIKMQQTYEKLRARTLSATSMVASTTMRRHGSMPSQDADDGGFSSDDEDYDHDRAARASVSRQSSFSFPTARLSAVKNVKLPTSVSSLAMRFRSSSSGTTVSDDGSIVGNMSTLSGSTTDSPTSAVSAPASYNTSTQDLKHKATACATRAAGILGAASAEAARKLKASRAFRSSPPASASLASFSMVAASPIVDNVECSPSDLPPPRPREQGGSSNVAAAASG